MLRAVGARFYLVRPVGAAMGIGVEKAVPLPAGREPERRARRVAPLRHEPTEPCVPEGSDPAGAAFWFPPGWQWNGFLNSDAHRSTDWTDEIKARTDGAKHIWYLAGDGVDGTYPPSPPAERTLAALGWQPAGGVAGQPAGADAIYQRGPVTSG